MSILLRAALLGGIAYLITRSLSSNSMQRRSLASGAGRRRSSPAGQAQPGESHVWPTSEAQSSTADAGPTS